MLKKKKKKKKKQKKKMEKIAVRPISVYNASDVFLATLCGICTVRITVHAGLGNTVSEIDVSSARIFSKTIFSMAIPEVMEVMAAEPDRNAVVLFGIETQVSQ